MHRMRELAELGPAPAWRQEALHVGAVGLVEWVEDHPEGEAPLVTGHLGKTVFTQRVPLLLGERHCSERDNVLLLVVEV